MDYPESNSTQTLEREALEKVLFAYIKEQRASRRWRIFFRFFFAAIIIILALLVFGENATPGKSQTAMIDIKGEIADDGKNSAKSILDALSSAYDDKNTKGIILNINSPGGSPVQAGEVYDELLRMRKEHPKIKVYAVCADSCASGGYYIAAGADAIYANKASVVGSIGVVSRGFGFVDAIQKIGVTRRLLTSGTAKGFLDPFVPLKADEVTHMQSMLDIIHQQFIESIKNARGPRLKESPDLYTGTVWTGDQALALGLIDGLGSTLFVARELIKEENIVDFTQHNDLLTRFANNVGASAAEQVFSTVKFRLM